jgi:hypothetical protein
MIMQQMKVVTVMVREGGYHKTMVVAVHQMTIHLLQDLWKVLVVVAVVVVIMRRMRMKRMQGEGEGGGRDGRKK